MKTYRPTWIEINLSALISNLNQVKRLIPHKTEILATVKADAYGHGLIPVAGHLVKNNVDYLGVATIEEALQIKKAGIKAPILILGTIMPDCADVVIKNNFVQTVYTKDLAFSLNKEAKRQNKKAYVHIKIDTGMGRQGIWYNEAVNFTRQLKELPHLILEGIFTHFPCADTDFKFTFNQINNFNKIISSLSALGINIPLRHCANSMGIIGYKDSHFNLVRPGLMLYGLCPKENIDINLKPVLSLKSKIIFLKDVPKNTGISYGHTHITTKESKLAIVPIGYGDGYSRSLSNKAVVLVKGQFAKIIGNICMDQLIIDVSYIKGIQLGDEVVLIGKQKEKIISAEELSRFSNTIPYEIVCGFNSRIPRIYQN